MPRRLGGAFGRHEAAVDAIGEAWSFAFYHFCDLIPIPACIEDSSESVEDDFLTCSPLFEPGAFKQPADQMVTPQRDNGV